MKHAQHGLDIQAETGSVKKRGQLLAEKFVGLYELGNIEGTSEGKHAYQDAFRAVQDWLKGEETAGRSATYDYKVVTTELLPCVQPLIPVEIDKIKLFDLA